MGKALAVLWHYLNNNIMKLQLFEAITTREKYICNVAATEKIISVRTNENYQILTYFYSTFLEND